MVAGDEFDLWLEQQNSSRKESGQRAADAADGSGGGEPSGSARGNTNMALPTCASSSTQQKVLLEEQLMCNTYLSFILAHMFQCACVYVSVCLCICFSIFLATAAPMFMARRQSNKCGT
jgi:hypothetical protein